MSFSSIILSFLIYFSTAAISVLFIKRAERKKSKFCAAMGVLVPTIVATFRESGIDFDMYQSIYNHLHAGGSYPTELGWNLLNRIAPSYKVVLFVAALLFYSVSYNAIKKFETRYRWMSWMIIITISTGMLYNTTRQAIATSFVFLAITYFYKKKYWRFAMWVIAAAVLFHKTAIVILLLLPLYWFLIRRTKKLLLVTAILSGIAIIIVPIVVAIVGRLGLYPSYIVDTSFKFSPAFLFYTFPPLLYYAWRPSVFKNDKKFHFCLSLYLFVIPMQFLGMRINYADRIMTYFRPMIAIAVPLMIAKYEEKGKGKLAKVFYVLWFIFYHVIMGVLLNENGMYPYRDF